MFNIGLLSVYFLYTGGIQLPLQGNLTDESTIYIFQSSIFTQEARKTVL